MVVDDPSRCGMVSIGIVHEGLVSSTSTIQGSWELYCLTYGHWDVASITSLIRKIDLT